MSTPASNNPPLVSPQVPGVPPVYPAEPIRVVIENGPKPSRFVRWLPWGLLAVSMVFNLSLFGLYVEYVPQADVNEKLVSHKVTAQDKVAIINVSGVIMSGEGFVKKQIDAVKKDKNVKAIVLRVDSPGGTITGSHFIYHQLREVVEQRKIPLVVSMGSYAASGGYYIAMAVGANDAAGVVAGEKVIYAEPTTTTGSIGVILPHYNVEGLLKEWKIENDSIKSHPLKDLGSITRKMSEEERKLLQTYIDESFGRFKDVVHFGRRHLKRSEIDAAATGEIFTSTQALQRRLIDSEGFLEDAVKQAIKLARLGENEVRVVKYEPPATLWTILGGQAQARPAAGLDLAALLDLSTPRAYYLCSWLPSATMMGKPAE
jgi:protease-4